jgi:amidase
MINDVPKFPSLARIRAAVLADSKVAKELAATALERIDRFDTGRDGWHSIISVDRDAGNGTPAGEIQIDSARRTASLPLAGVPIVVKDNIDTVALGCTAGSVLLENVPVESDAPLVTDLKHAGATIIGKANLSEWANFRSRRSVSGWSSVGGQTIDPAHPQRTPCGSSSGSAVAVAGGIVPVSIGTETDGSIICPAATLGLVGFKPTVGRVSRKGIVPISARQDSAGPIAQTVTDAWIVQSALERPEDQPTPLDPARLEGARIGIYPMDSAGRDPHPQVRDLFAKSCEELRRAGAVLLELDPIDRMEQIDRDESIVLHWEFMVEIERYLATRRPAAPFHSLRDLIAANTARAAETMPLFGHDIWETIAKDFESGSLTEAFYREACERIDEYAARNGIDRWFREENVDVVIASSNGPAWVIDTVNGDHYSGSAVPPSAPAGYPVLTVPMGRVRDLPIGMGFYGPTDSDGTLFSFGLAWESIYTNRNRLYTG